MSLDIEVSATFTADSATPFTVEASLSVADGETLVVLGPSGSGKTLLLETVAGFHDHDGRVELDGRDLTGVPPEGRAFGFVFQDYALFPHMTVRENVRFGKRYHPDALDEDRLLADLGVADIAERYPPTLSGGEAQRVALARALAVQPEVLLLDEPLSSLDVPTRQSLREDLHEVLDGATAVHVTHNRTTARTLADRIAVMRDGRVVQTGTPEDVFERPESPFVARFTGSNVFDPPSELRAAFGLADDVSAVAVRPECVEFGDGRAAAAAATVTATVERVTRADAAHRVTCSAGGATFDGFASDPPAPGDEVKVAIPDGCVRAFPTAKTK